MKFKKDYILYYCFGLGVIFYFCSESVLRQATVSNVDSDKLNIETIINDLPQSIRDAVKHKIEVAKLRDNVATAGTPQKRLRAILQLANAVKGSSEKEELYLEVFKNYSSYPAAARAYAFFLCNPDSDNSIDIKKYHEFIKTNPMTYQVGIWQTGISKLQSLQLDKKKQLEYLKPLLNKTPKLRDYHSLYDKLALVSVELGDYNLSEKARDLQDYCYDLVSLETLNQSDRELDSQIKKIKGKKRKALKKKKAKKKKK